MQRRLSAFPWESEVELGRNVDLLDLDRGSEFVVDEPADEADVFDLEVDPPAR